MGLQALRKYRQEIRYLTEKFEATNPDPWKKLKGYFGFFQYILKPGNEVCPAGVFSAEFNTLKPELQKELQEFFSTMSNASVFPDPVPETMTQLLLLDMSW